MLYRRMDITLIVVLVVVIIIIIYILYQLFNSTSKSDNYITGVIDLKKQPIDEIVASSLKTPTSKRYAVGTWVYVNTWNTNGEKILITKGKNAIKDPTTNNDIDFCLYLDKIQPNLICSFKSITDGVVINPITIMSGFPLQKWTYVVISVDNQIFDAYINGKLVVSHKLEALPQTSNTGIFFGDGSTSYDIQLSEFQRWVGPIDPSTAWGNYLSGAKESKYSVKISVLTNNEPSGSYRIF